jgi:hypothetical protein
MTQRPRITAAFLGGALALALAGCGGGSSKHAAATATSTTATTTTATTPAKTKKKGKAAAPAPKPGTSTSTTPKPPPLSQTPATTLKYSGTGVKELGVVRIPKDSTIHWTNDGQLFQIIPASIHVQSPVNSMAHSGEAPIGRGAYHGFLVNAVGHWTISIVPG